MNDHGAALAEPGTTQQTANSNSVSAGRRTPRALQPFDTLPQAMEKFVIEGGYPLSGTVVPAGNKNAALPILAASILTEEEVVIGNVPRIRDVDAMLALLEDLGVSVTWRDEHELSLRADSIGGDVDPELASRIRASFLLAGPLLARMGEAHMPLPGGDFIG